MLNVSLNKTFPSLATLGVSSCEKENNRVSAFMHSNSQFKQEESLVTPPASHTQREFSQVKDLVLKELSEDERTRNCDTYLVLKVLRYFTPAFIPFKDFGKLPSLETITRCRRLIQNKEGRFLPTNPLVVERRRKRECEIRRITTT